MEKLFYFNLIESDYFNFVYSVRSKSINHAPLNTVFYVIYLFRICYVQDKYTQKMIDSGF